MKRALTRSVSILLLVGVLGSVQAGEHMKKVGTISGAVLEVVQVAIPKLREKQLNPDDYEVSVFETDSSFVVLFDDPNRPAGQRGSTEKVPAFEVEIAKADRRVVRANFVR
jgi:hypothetical protein